MLNFEKKGINNICLVGMMGCGKSIIGNELGEYYKIKYIDSDKIIEEEVGESINDIFKNHGEIFFRNYEEKICQKLLNKKNCIISLGGGSVENLNIRNTIKKNSYSIYLKVDIGILYKRLKNSIKRPLLNNVNKKLKLQEIYNRRKEFYNNADLIVDNNYDKNQVMKIITNKLILK